MVSVRHIAAWALCVTSAQPVLARSVAEVLALLDQAGAPEVVLEAAGLPSLPLPPARPGPVGFVSSGTAALEKTDLRLALMQLALQAGTNDQLTLLQAQSDQSAPKALVLRSGKVSLSELGELARAAGSDGLSGNGLTWTLSLPLVIWQDAALDLQPGEHLVIERSSGAFLLGFGGLTITEASLSGSDTPNPRAPEFRPFVLMAGAGTVLLDKATLSALGFGAPNFGGLSVANGGLFKPEFGPRILSSSFDDVRELALDGSVGARIESNALSASSVLLTGVDDVLMSHNRLDGSPGTAAVTLDKASQNVTLTGNLITASSGMGLLIDGLTERVRLIGNVIDESGGVGVNIRHTACLIAAGNVIARSTSSAVRLTATGAVWLSENALLSNRSAGVDLVDQSGGAPVVLSANWLSGNTVGLKGGEIGSVLLSANDLTGQFPRQFGGAFAPHLPAYLAVAEGASRPGDYVIRNLRTGPFEGGAEPLKTVRAGMPWPVGCEEE
jgi:mannuronan 5-epimerase